MEPLNKFSLNGQRKKLQIMSKSKKLKAEKIKDNLLQQLHSYKLGISENLPPPKKKMYGDNLHHLF